MFEKEIAEGIKLLNKINPGWADKINLDKLKMSSASKCIIGQVYGDYCDSMENLEREYSFNRFYYGFTSSRQDILTEEWKDAIINIRSNVKSTSILDINPYSHEKLYTKDCVKDLLNKVMELGMTTRQDQLNCSELRSGREVLEEFIKTNL